MAALPQCGPLHSLHAVAAPSLACLVRLTLCLSHPLLPPLPLVSVSPTMSSQDSSRHPQPSSSPDSYSVGLGPNLLSFANKSSDPAASYSSSFSSKQSQWSAGGASGGGAGAGSEWNRPQGSGSTSTARGNTGTGWGAFSSSQGGRASWNAAPSSSAVPSHSDSQKLSDGSHSASSINATAGSSNGSASGASEMNGSHDYNSMLNPDSAAVSHPSPSAVDYSQQQNGGWDGHTSDASSAWSTNPRAGAAAAASWDNSSLASASSSHSDSSADAWKQKSSVPSAASAAYSRPLATSAASAPSANTNNTSPSSYRPTDFGDLYLDTSRPTIWCYKDPQGEVQGPFDEQSMRAWYNNRFFDLKVTPATHHQ